MAALTGNLVNLGGPGTLFSESNRLSAHCETELVRVGDVTQHGAVVFPTRASAHLRARVLGSSDVSTAALPAWRGVLDSTPIVIKGSCDFLKVEVGNSRNWANWLLNGSFVFKNTPVTAPAGNHATQKKAQCTHVTMAANPPAVGRHP